jgi:Ca2+-binding RTX toxin-like protein
VANVPASTNSNSTGSALDVRNETYAETYAKSGVTSNYANTTAHKYAEVNGNQALNDARAETYVYKDAGLAITSTVKTAVADAAYINGVERIVESNVANYHYADTDTVNGSSGTVDYIVTDTRNLAQSDQRTYTNITTTNVAQFKVVDKTVAAANGGALTVEASGIITGTTTNLSTPVPALVTIDGVPQAITFTSANNAKFHVFNTNYDLTIDSKEFTTDAKELTANALNQNVFDNVLGNGVKGLGNGGSLFAPINDATSQPVRPIELASAKYLPVATFLGTDFADVIKVNEIAGAVAGTFFGGNVNGGAGNDAITGSKGNDTIEGGAGKDVIDGGLGVNSLTGGFGQDTFVVSGTDTITDFVADVKEVIANPTAVPPVVGVTAVLGDTITIKPGATARIADTEDSHRFFTVSNPTTATTATTDMTIKTVAEWNAAKLSATLVEFDYSTLTTAPTATVNGTDNADLMLGSSFADKITGGKGHDTIKGGEGDDSLLNGLDGNDSVEGNGGNDVLRGNNGDDILIGGAGSDMLNGGAGKDVLTGGADADTFAFTSAPVAGDSTTITDFATTVDKIDLNGIDANSAIAANQDFSSTILAGTAAFTAAGQLRFNATTNTLEGNTDANFATTEFSVVLTGVAAVVATDFVL